MEWIFVVCAGADGDWVHGAGVQRAGVGAAAHHANARGDSFYLGAGICGHHFVYCAARAVDAAGIGGSGVDFRRDFSGGAEGAGAGAAG